MEEERDSIRNSIKQISYILNHWTNLPQNGQPPYSPLRKETLRSLEEELELLKKYLAETEKVRKEEFNQAGLEDNTSYQITFVQSEHREIVFRKKFIPIIEPRLDEIGPIRFEPIRFEPRFVEIKSKRLKIKPQKKSDGWRAPNKNQNKPVCRY